MATIKCKKDLFNAGQCFTKNKEYELVEKYPNLTNTYSLVDKHVINDLGERHCIGMWHKA